MEAKKPISNIIAGVILACIMVAFYMVMYYARVTNFAIGLIPYIIMIVGIIVFVNLYGNALNNQVSFGELFGYGFKIAAMMTLVLIAFIVIVNLLMPEIRDQQMEMAREQMVQKGNATPDEIDKGIEAYKNGYWIYMIGGTILLNAVLGLIGSLIGAAVTKKKPIMPSNQLNL